MGREQDRKRGNHKALTFRPLECGDMFAYICSKAAGNGLFGDGNNNGAY
jgi:hypothetical protein